MNRRRFLQAGLGATACGALGAFSSATTLSAWGADAAPVKPVKKIPLALQVYSLREYAAKDLPGTMKKIAEMGYEGVEFAGYYGKSAKEVRKALDDAGLKAISTHLGVPQLLDGAFEETVEFEKTLGNSRLIVAGGLSESCKTDAGNQMTAYLFNEIAAKAAKVGMQIGFHAHYNDFADINGKTAWEVFFNRTRKDVIAQMDVGNCLSGGGDPYAEIEKQPGRGQLLHVKAHGKPGTKGAVVASPEDSVDWAKMFELCETKAGVEWYVVEQEDFRDGSDALEACAEAFENLKKMGKA